MEGDNHKWTCSTYAVARTYVCTNLGDPPYLSPSPFYLAEAAILRPFVQDEQSCHEIPFLRFRHQPRYFKTSLPFPTSIHPGESYI